jgi:hypothetical protein
MEHSHTVRAFVSWGMWVVVKYFWDQCLLGILDQISQSVISVLLIVAVP